jgi:hypothetical protein
LAFGACYNVKIREFSSNITYIATNAFMGAGIGEKGGPLTELYFKGKYNFISDLEVNNNYQNYDQLNGIAENAFIYWDDTNFYGGGSIETIYLAQPETIESQEMLDKSGLSKIASNVEWSYTGPWLT